MKKVLLSNTDIYVPPLAIGTANFGTSVDKKCKGSAG